MGYTKIVQYGDIVEVYQYEKNIHNNKKRHVSKHAQKRRKAIRDYAKAHGTYKRPWRSVKRSKEAFYRLCHHNNYLAKTIHFLTITFAYDITLEKASRHARRFLAEIASDFKEVPVSYISVPELTKAGRIHFHVLVYNLPSEATQHERKTRNYQRLFGHGFVDFGLTTYLSTGLAGYMAKYMGKALGSAKNEAVRGYNCSRNIDKPYSYGSNTVDAYADMILSPGDVVQQKVFEVPYFGSCNYIKSVKK